MNLSARCGPSPPVYETRSRPFWRELATDAEYLRQAMDEADGLTYSGTESDFGMMVEVVNGEQAIYAEDNAYWAFYVDGEYGQYGIDSQPVEDGVTYSIVYEAA